MSPEAFRRQTGIPGFAFTSRISLWAMRLAPTFAAPALFIFAGTTASPSSRAAKIGLSDAQNRLSARP
jgi:hypothetical protein